MEYTDYWVAKGSLAAVKTKTTIFDDVMYCELKQQKHLVPFATSSSHKKLIKAFDWILRVFDAESTAWGFELFVNAQLIGAAEFGENTEWGIGADTNGFNGDLSATARGLRIKVSTLKSLLADSCVEAFCQHVGFEHQPLLYPQERPTAWAKLAPKSNELNNAIDVYVYLSYSNDLGWYVYLDAAGSAADLTQQAKAAYSAKRKKEDEAIGVYLKDNNDDNDFFGPVHYSKRHNAFWQPPVPSQSRLKYRER